LDLVLHLLKLHLPLVVVVPLDLEWLQVVEHLVIMKHPAPCTGRTFLRQMVIFQSLLSLLIRILVMMLIG
jgi:hypothetical protein